MEVRKEIKQTLQFFYESRIQGKSASMCINAEHIDKELLMAFDEVRLMDFTNKNYQPAAWLMNTNKNCE